jgi:hypothetical protein
VLVSDHVVFTGEALAEFVTRSGFDSPVPLRESGGETAGDGEQPEDSEEVAEP